jgi:hypothetical protein
MSGFEPIASAIGRIEENRSAGRTEQIAIRFENAAAKAFVSHCVEWNEGRLQLKTGVFTNI